MIRLASLALIAACVAAGCDREPPPAAPEVVADAGSLPRPDANGGSVTGFDGEAPPPRPATESTAADAGDDPFPQADGGFDLGAVPAEGAPLVPAPGQPAADGLPAPPGVPAAPVPPAPPTPPAPPEPAASDAVAVIRGYYQAINAGNYPRAYASWGDGGRASGQTADQFAHGFSDTARVTVRTGEPGRVEGAAGSRYVTVPVAVEAVQADGSVHHYDGTYTLRRAVVDGATDEQRQWRISDADLREVE